MRQNILESDDKTSKSSENEVSLKNKSIEAIQEKKEKKVATKKVKCGITDFNTYLFHEGKNYNSYAFMGSHMVTEKRKKGVRFSVWAPNAKSVYVVGDFSSFEIREENKMEKVTEMGIWSLFIPNLNEGTLYKYSIENIYGEHTYKADPFAFKSEIRPNTASVVVDEKKDKYRWNDRSWMTKRRRYNMYESPINIYEMHLGSWKRKNGEFLTYKELADELPKYLKDMSYTHVELMPLMEHPLDASWGYQTTGYYSATTRYGNASDLKYLIDELHKVGVGVILDWVPGHFCKDIHGLYRFDGTPTYEYQEEWKAENKGWGTCNFDLGRPEVKSFLISNAVYWLKEFHIDGLRVDAVSNILYLNYGRNDGEWVPNIYGENGNLEAIEFIKTLNGLIRDDFYNVMMIAEEATSWPKISKPIEDDGLGFSFKWNMGWMNDTLKYIEMDPIYRKYHHNKMNFSMMYNYNENFILPISHDEVVHGKNSLINKMWGDTWNKFAGLRLYTAYMIGHPGKKLLFMGSEFGQFIEWREYEELEWFLIDKFENHKKTQRYFKSLNKFYKDNKALWELDYDYKGFEWIDADNNNASVFSFIRKAKDESEILIFILNFTPVVRYDFRLGVPYKGEYTEVFNTDGVEFGGSGQVMNDTLIAEDIEMNNRPYSIKIKVPPMAATVLSISNINNHK